MDFFTEIIYYNFNMDLADFKERLLKHPLPGGTDNFKILMDSGRYYVDKTLFVQDIMNYPYDSVLFTRPRRFGKTLNMSVRREIHGETWQKVCYHAFSVNADNI